MTNQNIASIRNSILFAHDTQNHLNFHVDQPALSPEQSPTIWASFGTKFQYPASPFHCRAHTQCTYLISSQAVAIQVGRCPHSHDSRLIHGDCLRLGSSISHHHAPSFSELIEAPASSPPATLTHLLRKVYVRTEHRARSPYRPV